MILGRKYFRRHVSAIAAYAVLLLICVVSVPASAEPSYWTWFKHTDDVTKSWQISAAASDPLRLEIRRRMSDPEAPRRRIFVLYPRPSSAYDVAISKILNVFDVKNIDADFTVMNFNRDPERAAAALAIADKGNYELIFSMGSESTAWLYANYRGGKKPVVSVCSKDPVVLGQTTSYTSGSGTNFAFTSLNMPVEVQMEYVRKLKPKLRNIGILVNSKNVSAVQTQAQPLVRHSRKHGIRVMNLAVKDPKNARAELAMLVSRAVARMRKNDPTLDNSLLWITGSTAVFREIETINKYADRVPVLAVVPDVVKAGDGSAVLSVGISFESNAHLAAIYGTEVLDDPGRVSELNVGVVTPPDIAINFLKAREIGLKIPYSFFESAGFIYDYDGRRVRNKGRKTASN